MPLINVRLIEGVITPKQKQDLIQKITEAVVEVEGENLRPYTLVILDEVKSGDWSIGGHSLSAGEVRAIAAGKAAA